LSAPPRGLYLHVPFCVSHCPYCDFVVVAGREARGPGNRVAAFAAALEAEVLLRADALDARWGPPCPPADAVAVSGRRAGVAANALGTDGDPAGSRPPLATLYLGGGTPSLLPAEIVARWIALARERFGLEAGAEVTLEVNPGADERGDALGWRDAGVTRLSIGAQSMDPGELRSRGGRHGPEGGAVTVAEARSAGIESISVDLLYDVPGQTLESWAATLERVIALGPDHVSAYALTLDDPDAEGLTGPAGDHLPTRPGARQWRERARARQDDDRAAAMYEVADERLEAAGTPWYEISNWARPGRESRHNLGYWRGSSWEAAGPGAHAFDGETRRWNGARLDAYVAALLPPDGTIAALPPGATSDQEPSDGEAAMLALRTRDGLPATALDRPELETGLRWALDADLLRPDADRLVLTRRGRLLSNEVFTRLI
jgi:oxygen-independent coproporphyrinogen-3 oxidase